MLSFANRLKIQAVSTFKAVAVLGLACLTGLAAVPAMADPSGDVVRVRMGGSGSTTRIVIEMGKSAAGKIMTADTDTQKQIIALADIHIDEPMSGQGQGIVKDWKLENQLGAARLKLNFKSGARIYKRFLLPPADGISVYRYVIDIVPAEIDMDAPRATPVVTKAPEPQVQMAAAKRKKVIVIDAGHGGKDPGARGTNSWEKDINLGAAKALRDRLEKTGRYKVIMTRETDSYVDKVARVRIARTADADLFISLHSDSGGDGSTSGASIYTLSDSGSERIAKKALIKGDWSLNDLPDDAIVSRILIDLTQRATKNRSATFAQLVIDQVGETTPLLRSSLRQAGFVVLLAPDVPAVLLEMGFVNNAKDEAMLTDSRRRDAMMGQVAKAIDKYFDNDVKYASLAGFR